MDPHWIRLFPAALFLQTPTWEHCFCRHFQSQKSSAYMVSCSLKWCWLETMALPSPAHLHALTGQNWLCTCRSQAIGGVSCCRPPGQRPHRTVDDLESLPRERRRRGLRTSLYHLCEVIVWAGSPSLLLCNYTVQTAQHSILSFQLGREVLRQPELTPNFTQSRGHPSCLPLLQWLVSETANPPLLGVVLGGCWWSLNVDCSVIWILKNLLAFFTTTKCQFSSTQFSFVASGSSQAEKLVWTPVRQILYFHCST